MKEFSIVCVTSASRQHALEKALAALGMASPCIRRDAYSGLAEVLIRQNQGETVLAIIEADHLDRDEMGIFSVLASRSRVQSVAWMPAGRNDKRDLALQLGAHQAVTNLADMQLPRQQTEKPIATAEAIQPPLEDAIPPEFTPEKNAAPPMPAPMRTPPFRTSPTQAKSGLEGVRLTLEKNVPQEKATENVVDESVRDSLARLRGKSSGDNGDGHDDPALKSLSLLQEIARRYRPLRGRPGQADTQSPAPTPAPVQRNNDELTQDELDTLLGDNPHG